MANKIKKGDRVEWKVGKNKTTGEIVEKVTESTTVNGQKIKASPNKPRYLVKNLNGYKIANPTILARISAEELEYLFRGYGYTP